MLSASAVAYLSAPVVKACANSSRTTAAAAMVCRYFLAYSTRNVAAFSDTRSAAGGPHSGCHRGHLSIALDRTIANPSYLRGRHGQRLGICDHKDMPTPLRD